MKKIFNLFLAICSIVAMGQKVVNSTQVSTTLPDNPPANTTEWASTRPSMVITAQTRLVKGKPAPDVVAGSVHVTIKNKEVMVCGYTTIDKLPGSNFLTETKTWTGWDAPGLMGKNCVLNSTGIIIS